MRLFSILFFIVITISSSANQVTNLDYLYRFPSKGESVLNFSIFSSIDEMEFDDRTAGIEEIFEVDRNILSLGLGYRYAISDKISIDASVEGEIVDFETHLEDENDTETPSKSPRKIYNPSLSFRYRFVDKSEVFFDVEFAAIFSNYNRKSYPINQTVSPFDGKDHYRLSGIIGIDFYYFTLMNSIGAIYYDGSLENYSFGNSQLNSEDSHQILLSSIVQFDLSRNFKANFGFLFLSADAFNLRGSNDNVRVDRSSQKNIILKFDYLAFEKSVGILSIGANQRIDNYNLLPNSGDLYVADNTYLDIIFKIEKWF